MHNHLPEQSHEHGEWIERIARPLRRPETLDATFESRLMSAIQADAGRVETLRSTPRAYTSASPSAARGAGWRSVWRWLVEPRTVRLSPAAGLAVAAGLAAIAVLAVGRREPGPTRPPAPLVAGRGATQDSVRTVEFVLVAPSASRVSLVGDFNDWNPARMPLRPTRANGGVWTISVPISIGRHQYAFLVDGTRWVTDPSAPTAVEDDFGVPNSVVTIGERTS